MGLSGLTELATATATANATTGLADSTSKDTNRVPLSKAARHGKQGASPGLSEPTTAAAAATTAPTTAAAAVTVIETALEVLVAYVLFPP